MELGSGGVTQQTLLRGDLAERLRGVTVQVKIETAKKGNGQLPVAVQDCEAQLNSDTIVWS